MECFEVGWRPCGRYEVARVDRTILVRGVDGERLWPVSAACELLRYPVRRVVYGPEPEGGLSMVKTLGVWIDHREAVIAEVEGEKVRLRHIPSEAGARLGRGGGAPNPLRWGPQDAMAEDRFDRKYDQALSRYYRRVSAALAHAEAIYVLGPGEAPLELVKSLDTTPHIGARVVEVEVAGQMTEPQFVAKVKGFFGHSPRRRFPPRRVTS